MPCNSRHCPLMHSHQALAFASQTCMSSFKQRQTFKMQQQVKNQNIRVCRQTSTQTHTRNSQHACTHAILFLSFFDYKNKQLHRIVIVKHRLIKIHTKHIFLEHNSCQLFKILRLWAYTKYFICFTTDFYFIFKLRLLFK